MKTLAQLQDAEAQRRLLLLGSTVAPGVHSNTAELTLRARQVAVPAATLRHWHSNYLRAGFAALSPTDWPDLRDEVWTLAEQRRACQGRASLSTDRRFGKSAENR